MLMKSKILLMIFLAVITLNLAAQPLHWRESLYNASKTSTIVKETAQKTEGASSLKYTFTDDGTPFFISDTFNVTGNSTYNYSIDYLDNDPAGVITARVYYFTAPNTAYLTRSSISSPTVDSPNWQTITVTGTTPATATLAYVIIRMEDVAASWTGSATFYADNAKYTEGTSTTNLITNPGFEEWFIIPGSTVKDWRESLYNAAKTSVITHEKDKKTEGYTSLKYTFTDDGTPFFISDTFNVTGSSTYNYSIDYLDNDPAGVITARVYYFTAPNTAYLTRSSISASTVDSPNWQTITVTGTTPATATLAYVIIRMEDVAASWTGSATFYADNAKYTEGTSTTNLIPNPGFEEWIAPTGAPEFLTYKFEGLTPMVVGAIDKVAHTVSIEVPYPTDVTALVSTFTLPDGVTAKVGATDQVSGTTPNNFTSPVTYTLTKGATTQDWIVTVTKPAPTTGKDIVTFKFSGLNPEVIGIVTPSSKTVSLEVPAGTNVTALVPTITLSPNATVSPLSGAAQNFTSPVTYTVTAQDASTQAWVVTVTLAAAGQTTLFLENFEDVPRVIKPTFKLINNDNFPMAAGEERWGGDSCWVVSTTLRPELAGTHVAMASSYVTMALTDKVDRWIILPSITLGENSTLSWQAMSTTTSGNYPDDYIVYIAPSVTGTTPTVSYFEAEGNELIKVAPENWSASVGRPGAGLANRSINLKNKVTPSAPNGWFSRNVWIAFVLSTDLYTNPTTGVPNATSGGSALAIDNIKVVNDLTTGIGENRRDNFAVSVYPNPTTGKAKIMFQLDRSSVAEIIVTDIIGKVILANSKSVNVGQNQFEIDLSGLSKGIYLVKTTANGRTNVSKLIVK